MDDIRLGNTLRALRIRKRLRQADLARRAGLRRETIGRLERGGIGRLSLDQARNAANALGATLEVRLRWQGADLDRVTGAAHADLHEALVSLLDRRRGWEWRGEVSFSIYGERGVIDILAWHPATRSLLIIELKTEMVDPQELVATMDRRMRLARRIAGRFGWEPATVSSWVVLTETSTNRRRVARHRRLLRTAFPADGRAIRTWLQAPSRSISALSLWSDVRSGPLRRTISQTKRIRKPADGAHERGQGRSELGGDAEPTNHSAKGPQPDI